MLRTTASTSSSACAAVVDMVWMNAALVAVLSLAGPAMSQYQSFYAGSGWSYPGPLPQFAANSEDSLENRAGQATTTTTTQTPDQAMASHVANWPQDRQPFWFVNREQMDQHIGRPQFQGSPQGQGTQGQPQNQPGGADSQQNQQPQDLPSTRSQPPDTRTRTRIGSQPEDEQSQEDMGRLFQSWLQNQSYNPRRQQWLQESPPDTQTQDTQVPRRWRGRPGAKTFYRPQY